MKKLLSFLALALCFVACQNEAVESVSNGDLANVVLTIDAPELGVTRADGDANAAKNSAFGAIDFLSDADWANYDLRYILEVYDANEDGTGTPIYRERMVNCLDKYAPTTFELRLVPNREYKFVVFADFVAEGNAELTEPADKLAIADLYYNTADLRNISAITNEPTWNAMNEIRDAYFISKNVNVTTGLNETLTLTRPFAKLRVIATDLDYIKGYSAPGYVEVTYHTEKVYKSFNAVNGLLNAEEMTGDELTYGYEVSKTIPYTAGYDEFSTNQTLFTDYLLAEEGEQTPVNFKMTVYEDASKARKIHEHDFTTQIPIQRNHLTTIIGDLLTTQANITIQIDDNFEDEFVIGWGDDNATKINVWNAGELNANGDYTFVVEGENDFEVTINAAAVENQKLTAGTYVLAEDAEEGEKLTFTVEALQANETTRALVDVEVIGGTMKVVANGEEYAITLDLVLQFVENKDVRHAIYTYEGPIAFGKVLETPKVEYAVEGNVITLTWNAVDGATSYTVSGVAEMPVVTEETSYVFTGEYETEYTFTVVAVSDDLASQPYTVVVTTEAAPVVDPEEPTVLATPVVTAVAKENTVTLTWEAVENAASYSITVGTEMPVVTEELTYTFTGEYETEYTFNVVAVPADEEKFAASEAAVVTATTEAAPAVTPETKSITVAEFLTMPEDETEGAAKYRLTGVITRMYRVNNSNDTLYGNFYLKDATGEVLIYGLMDKDGNKYWETSGAKIGDTITVETVRTSYNGSPQGKNSTFIELVPFVETASEWGVVGDLTNWSDNGNIPDIVMYNTWKAENLFVAYNVEIASGAFKIRANNEWNDAKNYGLAAAGKIYADKYYTLTNGAGSQNATPMVYGTYDVYFDLANERVALVTPGKEYADAVEGGDPVVVIEGLTNHEWGLVGSFNGWDVTNYVVTEVQGDWAVAKNVALTNGAEFKFAADKAWTLSYGAGCDVNVGETYTTYENGNNMKFVGEDGAYNIYFSLVDAKFYMEAYSAATTVTFNVADYNFANQAALASYVVGDVTIAFDGGGNNNSPKYYTSGTAVRCYPNNTITVSGKTIKKVEVVAPDGYTNAIDLYNDTTKLDNFIWEGSSENVVLTFDPNKSSGQSRFVKINVTYE